MSSTLLAATLYEKVVAIAEDYLGPSAPRFVERLVKNHLSKPSAQLLTSDMHELIKWANLSVAMLTDDAVLIAEFTDRLSLLSKSLS